jgi:hypothetical protein
MLCKCTKFIEKEAAIFDCKILSGSLSETLSSHNMTLINYEKKGLIKPSVALVFSCIEEVNPFKGLGRNSETKRDSYFFWPGDN